MPLDLSHIAVVDNHCHPWRRPGDDYTPETYRPLFTEGVHPRVAEQVPQTVYFRWAIRELARVLGCDPTEDDVLANRAGQGHDAFTALLMAEANVESAVLDHLFAGRGTDNFTVAQMGPQLGGARTYAAVRIETVLAELVVACDDAAEFEARFRARLDRAAFAAEGTVSLKSIAAYRTGLAIEDPGRDDAYAAFAALKAAATAEGGVRIADKVFLDYFLMIALRWCAAERFPIQFHSGYGDPDVDLRTGNPLQMRAVLQNEELRDAPIVFLHAGYPFVRELSYLAGVYPNVYLDLGLAIPFAATEFDGIVRQSLALAPSSRVLWSSDGFAVPEHCWFAAVQGRAAIGRELDRLMAAGVFDERDALDVAEQILRRNALELYGLATAADRL